MNRTQQRSRAHPAALAAAFLAGVIVALGLAVHAGPAQFELAAGFAKGRTAPDGIWWEHEFDTDNRVTSPRWSIGQSRTAESGWGVRWDFGQLLKFSTRNLAVGDESTAADVAAGRLACDPGTGAHCLLKFNGDGDAFGVHLGVYREFRLCGWALQPELGIVPYLYSWTMTVEHPYDGAPTEHVTSVSGASFHVSPYARVTLQRGPFFARLDYDYFVRGHDPVAGIQEGKILGYMLGAAWSF